MYVYFQILFLLQASVLGISASIKSIRNGGGRIYRRREKGEYWESKKPKDSLRKRKIGERRRMRERENEVCIGI